jgi:hypothetical protein
MESDNSGAEHSSIKLAKMLVEWTDGGIEYTRNRRSTFRRLASANRLASLVLSAAATVILGLQVLTFETGVAFAMIATVTTLNGIEPFFNWRSRWILMEEAQHEFHRLQDRLNFYIARSGTEQLDLATLQVHFDDYERIWRQLGDRWLEYRRASELARPSA